jgi:hypothetical protein
MHFVNISKSWTSDVGWDLVVRFTINVVVTTDFL